MEQNDDFTFQGVKWDQNRVLASKRDGSSILVSFKLLSP